MATVLTEMKGAKEQNLVFIQNLIGPQVSGSEARVRLRINSVLVIDDPHVNYRGAVTWMTAYGAQVKVRVDWAGQVLVQHFPVDSKPERRGFEVGPKGRLRWRHDAYYE